MIIIKDKKVAQTIYVPKNTEVTGDDWKFELVSRTSNTKWTYPIDILQQDAYNWMFDFFDPEIQNDEYEYRLFADDIEVAQGMLTIGEYNKDKNIKMFGADITYKVYDDVKNRHHT